MNDLLRDRVRVGDYLCDLASANLESGVAKPSAWAWVQVREEVGALKRDYGSGRAGVLEA